MFAATSGKRITAMLLAAMLLSVLASCGGGETVEETTAAENAVQETAAETEETRYTADYLPAVTYDGYQYRIISYDEYPAHVCHHCHSCRYAAACLAAGPGQGQIDQVSQ